MTRLRRLIAPVNWTYAVGELGLIVLGILIALLVNDWHQDREDRRTERNILIQMRTSIERDTVELSRALLNFKRHREGINQLRTAIAERRPHSPHMDTLFGISYWRVASPQPRTAAYDVLKSRGFDLIGDDSLRNEIATLYGDEYDEVRRTNELNQTTLYEIMRPYFLTHFKNLAASRLAVPLSYDQVMNDPYFDNILNYRFGSTMNNVDADSSALALARSTLNRIGRVVAGH